MIASSRLHFCRTVRKNYKIVTIILPLHSRAIELNKRRLSYDLSFMMVFGILLALFPLERDHCRPVPLPMETRDRRFSAGKTPKAQI